MAGSLGRPEDENLFLAVLGVTEGFDIGKM